MEDNFYKLNFIIQVRGPICHHRWNMKMIRQGYMCEFS